MPDPQSRGLRWIGLGAFCVGATLMDFMLPRDMLPLNQVLFEIDCVLIANLLLVLAIRSGRERS